MSATNAKYSADSFCVSIIITNLGGFCFGTLDLFPLFEYF